MRRRSSRSSVTNEETLQTLPVPIFSFDRRNLKRKLSQPQKEMSVDSKNIEVSETNNGAFCTDQETQIEEPKLKKRKMNEINKDEHHLTNLTFFSSFESDWTKSMFPPKTTSVLFTSAVGHVGHFSSTLAHTKQCDQKKLDHQNIEKISSSTSFFSVLSRIPSPTNAPSIDLIQLPIPQQLDYIANCLKITFEFDIELTIHLLRSFNKHWNSPLNKPQISTDTNFQHENVITWLFNRCTLNLDDCPNKALLVQFKVEAFQMLGLLARNDQNRDLIVQKGGLHLILMELRKNPPVGVFKKVCLTIGNIFNSPMTEEAEVQEIVEREGIVESIINTMKQHTDKPELIKQACFALGNLAFTGDFEPIVVRERGIETVLEAIRRHGAQHPFLLVEACFFLKNLCFGEKGRLVVMRSRGIPLIVNAVREHPNCIELLDLAFNIFYDLSFTKGAEVEIVEHDGIILMIDAIRRHLHNKDALPVLHEAIRALGRLYCICDDGVRLKMIRSGAITAILDALNVHSNDVELRQRACWSFYRMSKEKIELRYERTPESVVPSLKELTARQILRISPSLASFSSTSSPTPTTTNSVSLAPILNVLPLELCHYLTKESRRCSHCGAPFFDHFYELLQFRQFREHVAQLPVFLHLCSHQCFQQVKTK